MFSEHFLNIDILLFVGVGLVCGYTLSRLMGMFNLPAVVGYILAGIILGPSLFGIYASEVIHEMDSISDLALSFVAFIIGSELRWKEMSRVGKKVFVILLAESMGAFLFVFAGVYLITKGNLAKALIFASLAPATAPAGTVAVIQETRSRGILTSTLLAIVGLDDGIAILIFAFALATAKILLMPARAVGASLSLGHLVFVPVMEITFSILLGLLLGFILAYVIRKIRSREDTLVMTLGMVFICSGLANHLHLSLILANLSMGVFIANTYLRVNKRTLQSIQGLAAPVFVIFFVLAGSHLRLAGLGSLGLIGMVYFIMRAAGKFTGSWFGCTISKAPDVLRKYLGMALFSQAGVAVGLALVIQTELLDLGGEHADLALLVMNTIAATTLLFEIVGPIMTKIALGKAREAGMGEAREKE